MIPSAPFSGGEKHKQAVRSRRQIIKDKAIANPVRQVQDAVPGHGQGFSVRLGAGQDSQKLSVRSQKIFHQGNAVPAGAADIHMAFRQIDLGKLGMLCLKGAVGIACGKLPVVQHPDAHSSLFRFLHDAV